MRSEKWTIHTQPPDWIIKEANEHIYKKAQEFGIPLTHFVSCNRKTKKIVAARGHVITFLRWMFVQRTVGHRVQYAKRAEVVDDPSWQSLSYPAIGYLLDLSHSAIVVANRRMKKEQEQAVET